MISRILQDKSEKKSWVVEAFRDVLLTATGC
jgi:hypothetical protein